MEKKMSRLIAPSILSADFSRLHEEIVRLEKAGADWIHVDVMDGHFVPNLTIGPLVIQSIRSSTSLPFDVHLMIERPEKFIGEFINAGADYLTIHVEATSDPLTVLKQIRQMGCRPGITLKPNTSVEKIESYLPLVDLVLVMTVEPGFGGQSFMEEQVEKINWIRQWILKHNGHQLIEVDGGVNDQTLKYLSDVDVLVAGSYIFKGDYSQKIKSLKGLG